jgi:hypothetical protein
MGKPSVNRGKSTSTNSTHPAPEGAQQIPAQRNTRHKRPYTERFSAWAGHVDYVSMGYRAAEWPFRAVCSPAHPLLPTRIDTYAIASFGFPPPVRLKDSSEKK